MAGSHPIPVAAAPPLSLCPEARSSPEGHLEGDLRRFAQDPLTGRRESQRMQKACTSSRTPLTRRLDQPLAHAPLVLGDLSRLSVASGLPAVAPADEDQALSVDPATAERLAAAAQASAPGSGRAREARARAPEHHGRASPCSDRPMHCRCPLELGGKRIELSSVTRNASPDSPSPRQRPASSASLAAIRHQPPCRGLSLR